MRHLPLLLALALAGCPAPCATPAPNDLASAGAFLRGLVAAPKAWVAPAAGDAPAAARAQVPVAKAEIALADAAGNPIPGLFHASTDASGAYGLFKLPTGYTFVVQAIAHTPDGKPVTLEGLAHAATDPNAQTTVDLASTLLTVTVTDGLTGLAGDVDANTYTEAAQAVRNHLADQDPPAAQGATTPLGFDRAAAEAQVKLLASTDPTLSADLDKLKTQAATPRSTAAQLQTELAKTADRDPLDALTPVY